MIFLRLGVPHNIEHPFLYKLLQNFQKKESIVVVAPCKPLNIIYKDDNGIELLMMMLQLEPYDRIKTEVALKSLFFKDILM